MLRGLSVVHALWKPVPGRFKDYIAMPRRTITGLSTRRSSALTANGSRSRSAPARCMSGRGGIAAHWRYKDRGGLKGSDQEQIQKLRDLFEVQQISRTAEFMKNLKLALFPRRVYVFTPQATCGPSERGHPHRFRLQHPHGCGNQCVGRG